MKISKLLTVFLFTTVSTSFAGQERSGGCGLYYNGKVHTVGEITEAVNSPEFFVENTRMLGSEDLIQNQELSYQDLPELSVLAGIMSSMNSSFRYDVVNLALENLIITDQRTYVYESDPTEHEKRVLENKYQKLFGEIFKKSFGDFFEIFSNSELKILALTDTDNKETALLDGYFQLGNPISRMSILYHEMLWSLNPNLSYSEVATAELNFFKLLSEWNKPKFKRKMLLYTPAVIMDLQRATARHAYY